ncbi:MAG: hypothetical protein MZW92_80175 [Comamonadaceae bacterium]|nr:hypothetical protein [Comamonadaceae bacterium]
MRCPATSPIRRNCCRPQSWDRLMAGAGQAFRLRRQPRREDGAGDRRLSSRPTPARQEESRGGAWRPAHQRDAAGSSANTARSCRPAVWKQPEGQEPGQLRGLPPPGGPGRLQRTHRCACRAEPRRRP